ncbi:hypothetical protein VPH35_036647 [Triticum aestivum]
MDPRRPDPLAFTASAPSLSPSSSSVPDEDGAPPVRLERQSLPDLVPVDREHWLGHSCAGPAPFAREPSSARPCRPNLRFRSGVVRIRSTTSACLLHGLVLLLCGISVAGADETSADDATELKWELDEDLVRCVVSFLIDQ